MLANILSNKIVITLIIVLVVAIGIVLGIYYYYANLKTSNPTTTTVTSTTTSRTSMPSTTPTISTSSPSSANTTTPTTTSPPNNLTPITSELTEEEKALASGFIDALNTFISLTSSYQKTYPLQYSAGLLPVFTMPFPGLSSIEEISMKLKSKMQVFGRYYGTNVELFSTSSGASLSKYVGTVELNGKKYYNHSLIVNITFFEKQTYGNKSMTRNSSVIVKGWILTSEDMKETIYRAETSTIVGSQSINSSFKTITLFDDKYRPVKINITSYTATEPNVTVEIDYEKGVAKFYSGGNTTVITLNNTSNLWKIRVGAVEEKIIDGVKFYVIKCNLYYNNTLMGYMDYLLSSKGVPVSFYHGYITVAERQQDMYRSYVLSINTTSIKPLKH